MMFFAIFQEFGDQSVGVAIGSGNEELPREPVTHDDGFQQQRVNNSSQKHLPKSHFYTFFLFVVAVW